jgi:hypothetical protein
MQAMSQDGLSGQSSSQHGMAATAIDLVNAAAGCVVADARTATAMINAKMARHNFPMAQQFANSFDLANRFRVKCLQPIPKTISSASPTLIVDDVPLVADCRLRTPLVAGVGWL